MCEVTDPRDLGEEFCSFSAFSKDISRDLLFTTFGHCHMKMWYRSCSNHLRLLGGGPQRSWPSALTWLIPYINSFWNCLYLWAFSYVRKQAPLTQFSVTCGQNHPEWFRMKPGTFAATLRKRKFFHWCDQAGGMWPWCSQPLSGRQQSEKKVNKRSTVWRQTDGIIWTSRSSFFHMKVKVKVVTQSCLYFFCPSVKSSLPRITSSKCQYTPNFLHLPNPKCPTSLK